MQGALIIGDVHGCIGELKALLDKHGGDRDVILVGDLVAKGPDSQAVVQCAREIGAASMRGNHEAHVMKWRKAHKRGEPVPAMRSVHREVAESLSEADWEYLEAMPYYKRLDDFGIVVVHAGFVPGVPLADQDRNDMINMRSIREDGSASKRMEDGNPWASLWPGPEHVVFGHDALRGLQQHAWATGIDTGCVYGRSLTGLLLPEHEIVSVAAKKMWCDPMLGGA